MLRSVNLSDAASCSAECRGHVDCVLSSGGLDYTVEFFCEESIAENVPLFGNCGIKGVGTCVKESRCVVIHGKANMILLCFIYAPVFAFSLVSGGHQRTKL